MIGQSPCGIGLGGAFGFDGCEVGIDNIVTGTGSDIALAQDL